MNYPNKRAVAMLISALMLAGTSALATTNITGVTGVNGTFDINPTSKINNSARNEVYGFRQYQNFSLDNGDIANLIFDYNGTPITRFVNMVDNQINIQGLVKAVDASGNLNNGRAVFVSPNGMVVGPSGVLRVGTLEVFTPTQTKYNAYALNPTLNYRSLEDHNADITIAGKIAAKDLVRLSAKNLNVTDTAQIYAGVNDTTSTETALFDTLVNASVADSNSFAASEGKIYLTSQSASGASNVQGTIKSFANGARTVDANGNVTDYSALVAVQNKSAGGVNVGANISSKDAVQIYNYNGNLTLTDADTTAGTTQAFIGDSKLVQLVNKGADLNLGGAIQIDGVQNGTKPDLDVRNNGTGNLNITGMINNEGHTAFQNYAGAGTLNFTGQINNTNNNSTNGTMNILNHGAGLTLNGEINNSTTMDIWNGNKTDATRGANGLTIGQNSVITNDAGAGLAIHNYRGNMTVQGQIANNGVYDSTTQKGGVHITNDNTAGHLLLQNDTDPTHVIENNGTMNIQNLGIDNAGAGLDLRKNIVNTGTLALRNTNGNMFMGGNLNNSGITRVKNNGAIDLYAGQVTNSNKLSIDSGTVNIGNTVNTTGSGADTRIVGRTGRVSINGTVKNDAASTGKVVTVLSATGTNGDVVVGNNGHVRNDAAQGQLSLISGKGMTIYQNAEFSNNNNLNIRNNGTNNLAFYATLTNSATNNNKLVKIQSNGGDLDFAGSITGGNNTTVAMRTNNADLNYSGSISNSGTVSMMHTGTGLFNLDGGTGATAIVSNNGRTMLVNKNGGSMNVANGTITNTNGNLSISDVQAATPATGTGMTVQNMTISNTNGTVKVYGTGANGTRIENSNVTANRNVAIQNNKNQLYITGSNITTTAGNQKNIHITNKGANGLHMDTSTVNGYGDVLIQNISNTDAVISKPTSSSPNPVNSTHGNVVKKNVNADKSIRSEIQFSIQP